MRIDVRRTVDAVRQELGARVLPFAVGVVAGVAADRAVARRVPGRATVYAAGLVAASIVYPLAQRRSTESTVLTREWGSVALTVGVFVAVAALPPRPGARLAAAGWFAHAVFDHAHDRGPASRLPNWYPGLCAGYDIAVAWVLGASTVGTRLAGKAARTPDAAPALT